jgi:hypothetical protein
MKTAEDKPDMYYYLKQYRDFWRTDMRDEITNGVEELFCDKDQWDAFLKLVPKADTIKKD